jgi:mRNA interferase MazF
MKRGDLISINMTPQAGKEQAGYRRALVLTKEKYNRMGLAIVVPITSQVKGYPFERALPDGLPVTGVLLIDHVKSVDWEARGAKVVGEAPAEFVTVIAKEIAAMLMTEEN